MAVGQRILAAAFHQRLHPFHANDLACARGQRQREVAQAAEEIHHPMLGLRVQHLHRTTQQLAVDAGIDLREIGRAKRNADAELGQLVGQCRRAIRAPLGVAQQARRVRPAGLLPDLGAMLTAKGDQAVAVLAGQRQQRAEHQRQRMPRGLLTVAHRHLDLRHAVADGQRLDQRLQGRQQHRDLRRQHRTFVQIGHVAGFLLVKADQHPAA